MKDLQFYAENCIEEKQFTPQSVLRYISELEKRVQELENMKKKPGENPERSREFAMNWWNNLTEDQKSRVIIKHSNFLINGANRSPNSLTGREIELLNKKEENTLIDKLIRGDRI